LHVCEPENQNRQVGARLDTACRLKVLDFHQDGDESTMAYTRRATSAAPSGYTSKRPRPSPKYREGRAHAWSPYSGPRLNPRSKKLAGCPMDPASLYRVVEEYLHVFPAAPRGPQPPMANPPA